MPIVNRGSDDAAMFRAYAHVHADQEREVPVLHEESDLSQQGNPLDQTDVALDLDVFGADLGPDDGPTGPDPEDPSSDAETAT